MKKTTLLIQLFITIIISSCSTDDNDNDPKNDKKLVKKEYVSSNFNLQYEYNSNNFLTKINLFILKENINSEESFSYDGSNVIQRTLKSNNYTGNYYYSYDNKNRLIEISSNNNNNLNLKTTHTISYIDNVITVNLSSSSGEENIVTLKVNNSGLITKMTKSNFYSIFSYDSNGNIFEIKTFDNDNNLKYSHNYSYDNKPNPFYGQLESIYTPIFLNALSDANYGEIVYHGFEGYNFPYLKNNITEVSKNESNSNNFLYTYDNDNYPINAIEKGPNGNIYDEYDIEYFD